MSTDGIFMFLASALGPESKSFEEIRVEDYIRSYQSTGRPPIPVPQEPTDELQRKTLGLPPLFKPHTNSTPTTGVTGSASSSTPSSILSSTLGSTPTTLLPSLLPNTTTTTTKPRIVNAADIPVGQEFRTHILAGEKYQTIVCMPEYEGFSSEELRYYAYFRGNITSPVAITMDPFVLQAKELPTSAPNAVSSSDDKLQSQCALPEYSRHSPEELRVAFLISSREMTSNDLLGPQVPATSAVTPATPNATPIASLAPVVVPPPVIAAAPSASRFNFVFR